MKEKIGKNRSKTNQMAKEIEQSVIEVLKTERKYTLYKECLLAALLLALYVTMAIKLTSPSHLIPSKSIQSYKSLGIPEHKGKVIILLVDGMSFRFTNTSTQSLDFKTFKGKLTVLQELKEKEPQNVVHQASFKEAPTWTFQGITSTITGSFPSESIIDMVESSNSYKETILDGLDPQKVNYFIGDVYWKGYVKRARKMFKGVEFFNWFGGKVNQDHEVVSKIKKIVQTEKFDVIISQFSDLDSIVHKKGLVSEPSLKKLRRDDRLLRELISSLDNDTTLMITSDHGLNQEGHGGSTYEETLSLFFMYNRRGFLGNSSAPFGASFDFSGFDEKDQMKAVDNTETMCYYLSITCPFYSLGNLHLGTLPKSDFRNSTKIEILRRYLELKLRIVAAKMRILSKESKEKQDELREGEFTELLNFIENRKKSIKETEDLQEIKEYLGKCDEFVNLFYQKYYKLTKKFYFLNAVIILAAIILTLGALFVDRINRHSFILRTKAESFTQTTPISILVIGLIASVLASKDSTQLLCAVLLSISASIFIGRVKKLISKTGKFRAIWVPVYLVFSRAATSRPIFPSLLVSFWALFFVNFNNYIFSSAPGPVLFLFFMFATKLIPLIDLLIFRFQLDFRFFWSLLKNFIFEFFLLFCASLGDIRLFETGNYERMRPWMQSLKPRMIDYGELAPTIFLYFMVNSWVIKPSNLDEKTPKCVELYRLKVGIYFFYKIIEKLKSSSAVFGASERRAFHVLMLLQWVILVLTIGEFVGFLLKKFGRNFSQKERLAWFILLIHPVMSLIGHHSSALITMVLLLLVKNCVDPKNYYYQKLGRDVIRHGVVVLSWIVYFFSGERLIARKIWVKAGTMFYDDFHIFSILLVGIKVNYPFIMTILFTAYFSYENNHPKIEQEFKRRGLFSRPKELMRVDGEEKEPLLEPKGDSDGNEKGFGGEGGGEGPDSKKKVRSEGGSKLGKSEEGGKGKGDLGEEGGFGLKEVKEFECREQFLDICRRYEELICIAFLGNILMFMDDPNEFTHGTRFSEFVPYLITLIATIETLKIGVYALL